MHRRDIKGALHNFLATFTSRYSDYDGYWLIGFLLNDTDELKIDLLNPNCHIQTSRPLQVAANIAHQKFQDQLAKAGLNISCARDAYLTLTRMAGPKRGVVNGQVSNGHEVRCLATVFTDLGKIYQRRINIFVAPHNPEVESRNARRMPQTGAG